MDRPSAAVLEAAYDNLFHSTLDKLRDSALYGRLFRGAQDEQGVPGRSIVWKLFLTEQPPLTASLSPHPAPPLDTLRQSRQRYVSLLKHKMRAPDGSYEEGFHIPGDSTPIPKSDNWNLNNPLSLDSSNPWHAYFYALDARNTIRQDVERTFPEVPYFRSQIVQNEMTQILFVHASERENVGYRQGMHELLACVYRAVDFDSVEKGLGQTRPEIEELCDRTHVAADTYALFRSIMQRIEIWYEWRAPIPEAVSPTSPLPNVPHFSASGEIVSSTTPQPRIGVLANGQLDLKPFVAPIVQTCTLLQDEKLRAVDPYLWEKLREGGVEPQMYGIRWLRLLFTREFSMAESMVIWDGLFASVSDDPGFLSSSSSSHQGLEFALWISVAMLIRIRNNLIPGDYTAQLTQLLRYPAPSALGASLDTSNAPALLLSQAQLLLTSPTPASGVSLVMQNRNELGIPLEVPDPPEPAPSRRRRASAIAATAPPTVSASQSRTSHTFDRPRLQDMITNRLMEANESLGIQRGLFNTITELRKNLPDLSQTLIRTPSWNGSAISLGDEPSDTRHPAYSMPGADERPPWEPKSRMEVEREMAELRALLKTLGSAVGWAVDVLLLDEEAAPETKDGEKTVQQKKAEAVECMAYVRDVLARGGLGEVDEERLISEEEYNRQRRRKEEKARAVASVYLEQYPPKPVLPPPVAAPANIPDSSGIPRTTLSTRDPTRPISSLTRTPVTNTPTPHPTSSSITPLASRASHFSGTRPRTPLTVNEPRRIAPPWQHTPSNFSANSPYASGSLPRLPPPSTTAPPRPERGLSDHSLPRPSSSNTHVTTPEPPQADPLGVLR